MLIKSLLNANPLGIAHEMDRLFDSMIAPQIAAVPGFAARRVLPAINLWENGGTLYAEAELPGLTMDDLEVLVTEDELTIRGTRHLSAPESARALRRERPVGDFERHVGLPIEIDPDDVQAHLANGVLTVKMAKAPSRRPRRIDVTHATEGTGAQGA